MVTESEGVSVVSGVSLGMAFGLTDFADFFGSIAAGSLGAVSVAGVVAG